MFRIIVIIGEIGFIALVLLSAVGSKSLSWGEHKELLSCIGFACTVFGYFAALPAHQHFKTRASGGDHSRG